MKSTFFYSLTFLGVILVSGCELYYKKKSPQGAEFIIPQVNSKTVSFQIVKNAVFLRQCIACHGNSSGRLALETYESTKQNLDKIERSIFNDSMPKPPNPPLSNAEKTLIRTWIDAGAPEFALGEPSPTPPPVLEAKYSSIRKIIFEVRCATCHIAGGTAEKAPLLSYEEMLASPREIVLPKNPDESGLVIAIERQDDKRMPPPDAGAPLSQDEIVTIRKWIEDGAENN